MQRMIRNLLYLACFMIVFGFMVMFKHEEQLTPDEAFAIEAIQYQLSHMDQQLAPNTADNQELMVEDKHPQVQNAGVPLQSKEETSAESQQTTEWYEVNPGDTLHDLSQKFGIEIDQIKALDNLTGDTLYVGQKLILKK